MFAVVKAHTDGPTQPAPGMGMGAAQQLVLEQRRDRLSVLTAARSAVSDSGEIGCLF